MLALNLHCYLGQAPVRMSYMGKDAGRSVSPCPISLKDGSQDTVKSLQCLKSDHRKSTNYVNYTSEWTNGTLKYVNTVF